MKRFMIFALAISFALPLAACGGATETAPAGPTVSSISPELGSREGGTPVTIKGSNFTAETTVLIADVPVTGLVLVDDETLTCMTPEAPGGTQAGVMVKNPNGMSFLLDVYFYIPAPTLVSVSPNAGTPPGGVLVTLTGTGFTNYSAGPPTVTFDGVLAGSVEVLGDTSIRCLVPPGLGPVTVTISNVNGSASLPGAYRYFPPPTLTSLLPAAGTPLGGTNVTLSGTAFEINGAGLNTVTFGGIAATNIVLVDDNTITCRTPPGSGVVDVDLSNGNGADLLLSAFTYYPKPTLTVVTPNTGTSDGGEAVTLTGTGFLNNAPGANTVTFGGNLATSVVVVNDTTITCVTPAMPVGANATTVTNANGSATLANAFTATLSALIGSANGVLYKISTTNAATTAIGNIGYTLTGLAVHSSGTIYGTTATQLITINSTTGVGSVVGTLSPSVAITDLSFKGDVLHGINNQAQSYSINTTTAAVTTLGNHNYGTYGGGAGQSLHRGYEYNGNDFYMCTYYAWSGTYLFTVIPENSSFQSFTTPSGSHAIAALTTFKGSVYASNSEQYNNGTMTLLRLGGGSFTSLGSLPQGLITLAGTQR